MFHEVKLNFKKHSFSTDNDGPNTKSFKFGHRELVIKNYPWDFEPKQQH